MRTPWLAIGLLVVSARIGGAQGFEGTPNPEFGDAAEREREYDLQHVRIDARLDLEAKTIDGVVKHSLSILGRDRREIAFDAEGLSLRYVAVGGRKQPFRTTDDRVLVTLDRKYGDGESVDVEIGYHGSPVVGLYWVRPEPGYPDKPYQCWTQGQDEDNHYWVPIYDNPNDRTTWETRLTVKEGLTAVSNGVFAAVEDSEPGWRTFHYRMEQPNSTYLIAFAVGTWERYADTWRDKQIEYFVAEGVGEEAARRSFGETPDMLEFFSWHTGVEYPWPKYAQVAVAEFVVGGMENVSCTLQTDRTLHDETAGLERTSIGLVAHEAAHQWFGDLATCRSWADLWLNEGFATYYEALFREHRDGIDEFRVDAWGNQQSFKRSDPADAPRPMVVDFFSRDGSRDSNHVYTKGASVLHMLRFVLGDDAFRKAIRHYLEKHRLGLVDTHDFQVAIFESTGRNLEWFFQQWVYLAGYPRFEVSFDYDDPAGQGTLKVKQTQKTGKLVPVFRTPVDVEFVVDGRSDLRRVFVTEKEQTFSFALGGRPSRVRFDKGGWILKELTFPRPVEEWIEIAEQDDDVIGRLEAVIALKDVADPRAEECLARVLLSNVHERVKREAAEALEVKKGGVAKHALIAALNDRDARVRRRVVEALGAFEKDLEVSTHLVRTFKEDVAYGPRARAVESLAKVKVDGAFDVAELALIVPSHEDELPRAGLRAMAEVDVDRAAAYLISAATYGISVDLRHEAFALIGRHGDKFDDEARERAVAVVKRGLEDHYSRTRSNAIRALQGLVAVEVLDDLKRAAQQDPSERVRRSAARALERIEADSKKSKSERALEREVERLRRRVDALSKEPSPVGS